jgi:hypothetical protein
MKFSHDFKSQVSVDRQQIFDAIEELHDLAMRGVNTMRVDPTSAMEVGADPMEYIGTTLHFLYSLYASKYEQLTSAIISGCSENQFLVASLCSRTLFETTATIMALNESIYKVVKNAKNVDCFNQKEINRLIDIVNRHSRGGRFDWELFFSVDIEKFMEKSFDGDNVKLDSNRNSPNSTNVLTYLNKWYDKDKNARMVYAYLSELAHPNVGSSFLVMGDDSSCVVAGKDCNSSGGKKIALIALGILRPSISIAKRELELLLAHAKQAGAKQGSISYGSH